MTDHKPIDHKPIDEEIVIPPPSSSKDGDYLTRDIEVALEVVVRELIETEMRVAQVHRRQAAANVLSRLKAQNKERGST
jgi:hypothetical protein